MDPELAVQRLGLAVIFCLVLFPMFGTVFADDAINVNVNAETIKAVVVPEVSATASVIKDLFADPSELNLRMVNGSYAVKKIALANRSSSAMNIVVESDKWIMVDPSEFQLGARENKELLCRFLILAEESPERTGAITFTSGKQKVVLPIKVVDKTAEQEKLVKVQADKKQAEADKDAEIKRLSELLTVKDEEAKKQEPTIASRDLDIAVVDNSVLQSQIEEKDNKIKELMATLDGLSNAVKEKDAEIVRLKEENSKQQETIGGLTASLEKSSRSYKELQEKVGRIAKTHDAVTAILKNSIKKGDAKVSLDNDKVVVRICEFFPQGSAYPSKVNDAVLTELGKVLKSTVTSQGSITVIAHTDSMDIGPSLLKDFPDNQKLSEVRAEVVKRILSLRKGVEINERQVVIKGNGDKVPIADNKTPAGRAKNRRVEIIITPG